MKRVGLLLAAVAMLWQFTAFARAADDPQQLGQATIDKALAYLKAQQKPDSSWQDEADPPALTALVLRAFIADDKYDADQPFLEKGYDKLLSYQIDSGGIYKDVLACYNTAIAISALAESKEAEYRAPMLKALKYLRSLQWSDKISGVPDELRVQADHVKFGGFGYGKRSRPDLSNTQMALDALHDAGVKPDDPAFTAAVAFVSKCQNFSETNNQPWAGDDGGFIYTPADGGNSPAGEYVGIGGRRMLRSYGSMTYAGLKSMIYAGLTHDDPRVKAAWDWISRNFTVDENPGMAASGPENAQGGLYYYFYTMAHALSAYGQPVIVDPQGKGHDWRVALIDKLSALQRPDGSFIGQRKWMEDNPVLVTAYCVITLESAKKDLAGRPAQ
jgi:squalene-hopene/tetraprenyl-beta-curcumene cyclase